MKINGNLEVKGIADLRLRKLYEKVPTEFKKAGKLFVNEHNRLCIVDENLEVIEFSTIEDSDHSIFLGELITQQKRLNSSKINQTFSWVKKLKNDSTLYDLFIALDRYISSLNESYVKNLVEKTELNEDSPYLRYNSKTRKLEAFNLEKYLNEQPKSVESPPSVKVIVESNTVNRVHLIKHNKSEKYCAVQVINSRSGVSVSPASYDVEFSDENTLIIKLKEELPITVVVV